MTRPDFTEEFKIDAIKQITERGYSVADVSKRSGLMRRQRLIKLKNGPRDQAQICF